MAFDDLKDFLRVLRERGQLHEIEAQLDPSWEVSAVCRKVFDERGPALLFRRVGDHHTPLLVGALATRERYQIGLGLGDQPTSITRIREQWERAFKNPVPCRRVDGSRAPCKQVKADNVDLFRDPFPVPLWHYQDSAPYLGTLHAVISKDPETGWINLGNYRNEIRARDTLGVFIIPYRHIGLHLQKWKQLGKPMPVAIAVGLETALNLVAVAPVRAGQSEYDVAGGLKGKPVEVVQAETSDLLVPAHAQIVIEGYVPVDETVPTEGPFGEFAGYMGEQVFNCNFMKVTAVTYQETPIFQGTYEGLPPNESTTVRSIGRSASLYNHLTSVVGLPGIVDVCVTEGGCAGFHAVVSIRNGYPGHVRDVMMNCWGQPTLFVKNVIVVDEDIDPWDPVRVEWAIATTVKPTRDIEIVKRGTSISIDPSSPRPGSGQSGAIVTDLLGIDATRPHFEYEEKGGSFPALAVPKPEHMKAVQERWTRYGFRQS